MPRPKELTDAQETRLINHLDDQLLSLARHFETRHHPRAVLPDLNSFISALKEVHSLILSIPPVGASATLRVSFHLQILARLPPALSSYPLPLPDVFVALRTFDQATVVVLKGAEWDPTTGSAKASSSFISDEQRDTGVRGTDRVRIASVVQDVRETLGIALGVHGAKVNIGGEVVVPVFGVEKDRITSPVPVPVGGDETDEDMGTPSLVDASEDDADPPEEAEDDDDEDEDFEEVDVAYPTGDNDELFSVHFSPPPPLAEALVPEDVEPPRPGFDPDAEFGEPDEEGDELMGFLGDVGEDEKVAKEVEKVFAETRELLRLQIGA